MNISNILTLIGLAIAVFSVIPNERRNFILPLFTKKDIGILVLLFVSCHYLMSFEWLLENWFPFLSIFTAKWGVPGATWAYPIALVFIFYPALKILPCSFTCFNSVKNTVKLYKKCLEENETDLLVKYIKYYHVNDIQKYLQSLSAFPKLSLNALDAEKEPEDEKQLRQSTRKMRFASAVYLSIVQNATFIHKAANKHHLLFAGIIKAISGERAANKEFVQCYIKCLFDNKNPQLIQELQEAGNIWDTPITQKDKDTFPILQALFANTKMAKEHEVWYPVEEHAIQSLKTDVSQSNFLRRPYDSDLEENLWQQKIYIAIMYFKYMVNETIHNNGYVIWSPYFNDFTKELINLIPECDNDTTELFAHHLIAEQNSIMKDWLELAKKLNMEHRIIDTVKCLGKNIMLLCKANRKKIPEQFVKEQINSIVHHYFYLSNQDNENIAVQRTMEWIEKILANPENPEDVNPIREGVCRDYLLDVWDNFDKLPYQDSDFIGRFEENVINK